MGFIEDDVEEFLLEELWQTLLDLLVVDDDNIILINHIQLELSLRLITLNHAHLLAVEELLHLVLPIVSQRCRADHQIAGPVDHLSVLFDLRLLNLFAFIEDNTQTLQSLA